MDRLKTTAVASITLLAVCAMAVAASASPVREQAIQRWRGAIRLLPLPGGGCFNASYPQLRWHSVTCRRAPDHHFLPADAERSLAQEVGNGNDYSAGIPGLIATAIGSIPSVSAAASETGIDPNTGHSEANTFSLQLNSEFFPATVACKGHGEPSRCSGWQQFIYADSPQENEIFMEYWILKYNRSCPRGWDPVTLEMSAEIYCARDSAASTLPGGRLTVSGLSGTTFEARADVDGDDEVVMSTASGEATATGAADLLDLGEEWKAAEFGIFGDAEGSQATFSSATTITVHTALKSESDAAPECIPEGFTGETNNLDLDGTPALTAQPLPTIASQQTNASATAASCATAGSSSSGSNAPSAVTEPPQEVGQTGATLEGTVDPNGSKVDACTFEYGTSTAYGKSASCATPPGEGTEEVAVSAAVERLAANTTYDYRISATNAHGTTRGEAGSFKTLKRATPTVQTTLAQDVGQSAATLEATVDPNGASVTTCKFEYGTKTSYGKSVACSALPGDGVTAATVSAMITGLVANTTYDYRIRAGSAAGTARGTNSTFKTS